MVPKFALDLWKDLWKNYEELRSPPSPLILSTNYSQRVWAFPHHVLQKRKPKSPLKENAQIRVWFFVFPLIYEPKLELFGMKILPRGFKYIEVIFLLFPPHCYGQKHLKYSTNLPSKSICYLKLITLSNISTLTICCFEVPMKFSCSFRLQWRQCRDSELNHYCRWL